MKPIINNVEIPENIFHSRTDKLVDRILSNGYKLFMDQNDDPCISDPKYPFIAICLGSKESFDLIAKLYWDQFGKSIKSDIVEDIIQTLKANAKYKFGEQITVYTRVSKVGNTIYYDIGDNIHAVEITKSGWSIKTEIPVYFRRYNHQKVQVLPERGGNLKNITEFINFKDESQKILLCTYLPTCLISDIDRPILLLHGPEGSGKT